MGLMWDSGTRINVKNRSRRILWANEQQLPVEDGGGPTAEL